MVKYYTAEEISYHNHAEDCWVYIDDDVYNLTPLLTDQRSFLAEPILKYAGKSVSHWFIPGKKELRTYIDPERNIRLPYTPEGRFLHVPPPDPTEWNTDYEFPWWRDGKFIIGKLSKKTRLIRILNMLTRREDVINVCQEETVNDIQDRYLEFNGHAKSYTWKAVQKGEFLTLNMDLTLEENDVKDESEEFARLGMDEEFYVPTLHIYFNDDLTEE